MRMFVGVVLCLISTSSLLAANQGDEQLVVGVIRAYHQAFSAGEPEKVVALLGPSYFISDERPEAGAKRLSAHFFLTGDKLRAWPKNYLDQVGPHKSSSETLSVSLRGDSAVVLTRDSGSNSFRSWRDEETAWFLGRVGGEWRIAAMIIRDFQLPKEKP